MTAIKTGDRQWERDGATFTAQWVDATYTDGNHHWWALLPGTKCIGIGATVDAAIDRCMLRWCEKTGKTWPEYTLH